MNILNLRRVIALLAMSLSLVGSVCAQQRDGNDKDPGWDPSISDKIKLPKYCWSQYDSHFSRQSGIRSPMGVCGVYANHICPGKVLLNRALDTSRSKQQRREYLARAKGDIEYSVKFLSPTCPLMPEVKAAQSQVQMLSGFLK
ncbi:MAG: hypothetical protein QFE16_00125 [Pseudomonadota bacterium]|nr:hypothetical protein [Pseudomonadota bacterium]